MFLYIHTTMCAWAPFHQEHILVYKELVLHTHFMDGMTPHHGNQTTTAATSCMLAYWNLHRHRLDKSVDQQ